jgi:hypothetical protein
MWRWIFVLLAVMVLQGCSGRAWYDGFQTVREWQCYDLQGNQREECLRNADAGYDQYQKNRKEVIREGSN